MTVPEENSNQACTLPKLEICTSRHVSVFLLEDEPPLLLSRTPLCKKSLLSDGYTLLSSFRKKSVLLELKVAVANEIEFFPYSCTPKI